MSLEIVKEEYLYFTGNPGKIIFKKRGILDTVGGYARLNLVLDLATPGTIGQTIVLFKNGAAFITFTHVDFPSEDPSHIPYWTGGSFPDFTQWLAQEFYKHPLLKKDYRVEHIAFDPGTGLSVICFIARERGAAYSLDVHISSTAAYATTGSVSGIDDVPLQDYKLGINIEATSDCIYNPEKLRIENIEATGIPDLDADEIKIELHELPALGRSLMKQDMPDNLFLPVIYRYNYATLSLEVSELVAGVGNKSYVQRFRGDMYTAANDGGMPLTRFKFYDHLVNFIFSTGLFSYFNYTVGNNRIKLTDTDAPEFINIIAWSPGSKIQFTVSYSDGSQDVLQKDIFTDYNAPYDIYLRVPTGWGNVPELALLQPTKTPISYTVESLDSGSSPETAVFTYIIDSRNYKQKRYFVYKNSLGFLDIIRFVGVRDFSIKRSGERITTVLTEDTSAARGTIEMVYNEFEETFTVRSGWMMSIQEKEFLTDFLRSPYVAEIILPLLLPVTDGDGNTTYYKQECRACDIIPDTTEMWTDDAGTWAAEFKMRYAHIETHYSNAAKLPKIWYDTLIEVTVKVNALVDGAHEVIFAVGAGVYLVTPKGKWNAFYGSPSNFGVEVGTMYFTIEASECTSLVIVADGLEAEITVTKIETSSLQNFSIAFFDEVKGDYLPKRLESLWSLQTFTIWANNDPGCAINDLLAALSVLIQNTNTVGLTSVDFSNSTPDSIGYNIAAHLTNLGVTVTTL